MVVDPLVGTGRKREAGQGHGMEGEMRRVWVSVLPCVVHLTRHIISFRKFTLYGPKVPDLAN